MSVSDSEHLRRIFGSAATAREMRTTGDPGLLLADEMAVVAGAVESRRQEFAAGRECARSALAAQGSFGQPLLPGRGRAPIWPSGFIGSITHCAGYAAAAVSTNAGYSAIGIDAEPAEALPSEIYDLVLTQTDQEIVADLESKYPRTPWSRIVFSAKESVYKAWYPIRGEWLGFEEASVYPLRDGRFRVRILRPRIGPFPSEIVGRWALTDDIILTGLAIDLEPPRRDRRV